MWQVPFPLLDPSPSISFPGLSLLLPPPACRGGATLTGGTTTGFASSKGFTTREGRDTVPGGGCDISGPAVLSIACFTRFTFFLLTSRSFALVLPALATGLFCGLLGTLGLMGKALSAFRMMGGVGSTFWLMGGAISIFWLMDGAGSTFRLMGGAGSTFWLMGGAGSTFWLMGGAGSTFWLMGGAGSCPESVLPAVWSLCLFSFLTRSFLLCCL